MTYKLFQDWYREANIKHLLLHEYNGYLISPPFATEKCREYNKIMKYDGEVSYINTELPPGTSKTNCVINVDGSSWFIPYGIYDEYNVILQLTEDTPINHTVKSLGKGQFYSGASNGTEGFSFPLGYDNTQYCIHIKNDNVNLVPFTHSVTKAHMGTVYCNNRFWSMPRGDEPGYNYLVSFDGTNIEKYIVPVNPNVARKFTDIIVVDNKLYSLPYGEQSGLTSVVEFDTNTLEFSLHELDISDFAKKFNCMTLCNDSIIGLPYGTEHAADSNYGILFNTKTKQSKSIDIEVGTGGKYRYRSAVTFNNLAWFFPSGTPLCPLIVIDSNGNIVYKKQFDNLMFGRPIIYNNQIFVLTYDILTEIQKIYIFDENYNITEIII
jgi:hypothetical protein